MSHEKGLRAVYIVSSDLYATPRLNREKTMQNWFRASDEEILWFEGIREMRDVSTFLIGKQVPLSQAPVYLGLAIEAHGRQSLNWGLCRLWTTYGFQCLSLHLHFLIKWP